MKEFFEYFYYRMAKINKNNSYEVPSLGLTATQFILVINFIFFFYTGPLGIRGKSSFVESMLLIAVFFGLDYYNNKLYRKRFNEFHEKWGNQTKKEKTVGMIKIVIFIVFSWGLIFLNGWIYNRYK